MIGCNELQEMAVNARFESSSTSSEPNITGNYLNGQRGNYSGPNLDRPGSFREGVDSRIFGTGVSMSRGSTPHAGDLPPLSKCLLLDPIPMSDQKYTRLGELRRAMGLSVGSSSEDNLFGAAHLKPPPSVAVEELKRFRSSVEDIRQKARGRIRKMDEHLHKLEKYYEAVNLKKPYRNDQMTNDRSGGGFNLKMGTQINRNSQEPVTQKVEDRPKNVLLNKRVRTSLAETRAEYRGNGLQRQPLLVAKDRDLLKDTGGDSDLVEEKAHILPVGGDGWDKKMKRKRSGPPVFNRSLDNDGELKRSSIHHKVSSEPILESFDAPTSRLAGSNVTGGSNKMDGSPLPVVTFSARMKAEPEGTGPPRDFAPGSTKEKGLAKGINRVNNRVDQNATCPSPVRKGKASRTPRTSSMTVTGSSPVVPRLAGALESWEHAPNTIKLSSIGGTGIQKPPLSPQSSSPPMAQWVGQRPQKMSRTRRSNLVSPVSNHDEGHISSDGCSPSDFGVKLTSNDTNGSAYSRNAANGSQQFRAKREIVQSPVQLSESEESGGCEKRSKEKGLGGSVKVDVMAIQNVGSPSGMITKKNKMVNNEDVGDGVRRQGRSGRGSFIPRSSISPTREKLDNATTTKPLRNTRPGSEKNGSKSGRPLKKLTDRRAFSRLGHVQNIDSPDFTGEPVDDREELLAAANFARNFSYLSSSGAFWKKMEPIYASLNLEDKSYLSQQLKCEDNLLKNLSQLVGLENNVLGDPLHEDISISDTPISEVINTHVQYPNESQDSASLSESIEPLYQRVLSALIIEDDIEDFDDNVDQSPSLQNSICNSDYDTSNFIDAETRKRSRMEFECDSVFGVQAQSQNIAKKSFSSTGSTNSYRSPSIKDTPCSDVNAEVDMLSGISKIFSDGPQILQTEGFGISSFDGSYEHLSLNDKILLELQSVDLYPEIVPDLDDKEDDMINQEIILLKTKLRQQLGRKKTCLEKTYKATMDDSKAREIEQVAMDRLVELAYRKLLATRGSSKAGITKASKQVALSFARRTLARCRKYEDSGISCFSEAPLRDIIFAPPPPRDNVTELKASSFNLPFSNNKLLGSRNSHPESRMSSGSFPSYANGNSSNDVGTYNHLSDMAFAINGPISNRGRIKEISLDDVVANASLRANPVPGETKLKRNDREREKDTSSARNGSIGKADRKTKMKPKQRTANLSTSGNGVLRKLSETTTHPVYRSPSSSAQLVNNKKRNETSLANSNGLNDSSKDTKEGLPLQNADPIDELVGTEQDLSNILNFDDDSLQDQDGPFDYSAGLEIPMDDIGLIMF